MMTNAKEIGDRIDRVLKSEQWAAIKKSFASRMETRATTSLSFDEKLDRGNLSIILNYELGDNGLYLSTYTGKLSKADNEKDQDRDNSVAEVEFNAVGRYVFSFQEAINLLEGRAVLKPYFTFDGLAEEGWFKLDKNAINKVNRFYFSGRQVILPKYDLTSVIEKLPVEGLGVDEKTRLIRSLECGDLREVKVGLNDKESSHYIQADPVTKGVSVFEGQVNEPSIGRFLPERKVKQHRGRDVGPSLSC